MTCQTHKIEQPFLPIAGALVTALTFVVVLCFFFEPKWESSDDVGMSMVAHGYGIAAKESPNLFFSNVLWGHLVQVIPEVNRVLGYSIATMATLVTIGTAVLYGLYRLGAGYLVSLSVFVLIMIRPVLFPQFTINAGLLMVCAIIYWHLYDREHNWQALTIGCILAFFSFLIRPYEFLLVLIIAFPLLSWRSLFQHRPFKLAMVALLSIITVSAVIDHRTYQQDSWKTFNEFNFARVSYTDFQASLYLLQRPDIFEKYGFSVNDIILIKNWFFSDPGLIKPQDLQAMKSELGAMPWLENGPRNVSRGLRALWDKKLLVLSITALLLIALRTRRPGMISLGLIFIAILLMGVLGRPGVTRVYTPLISLLIIAPFLVPQVSDRSNQLLTGVLALSVILNCFYVFSDTKKMEMDPHAIQKLSTSLPNETMVLWGASLPLETIYSVLRAPSSLRSHRFYGLGVFTLAPFSVAFEEEQNETGFIKRLTSESGIPLFSRPGYLYLLKNFCFEHLNGKMKEVSVERYGIYKLGWQRCEPLKPPQ